MDRLLSSKLLQVQHGDETRLRYWCQGCEETHDIVIAGGKPDQSWGWNGDVEKPVFTPSVLWRQGHYCYDTPQETCWCTYRRDHPGETEVPKCYRCHTFVGCNGAQPGEVIFLGDCSHAFAGTVQPVPDLPPHVLERASA